MRRGRVSDLDALLALENAVFTTDKLSRRSFRHFLTSPNGGAHRCRRKRQARRLRAGALSAALEARPALFHRRRAPHRQPRRRPASACGGGRKGGAPASAATCGSKSTSTIPAPSRATRSRAIDCLAVTATIMTTAATRCASRNRSDRHPHPRLTSRARIGFDGGHRGAAQSPIEFVSGYDVVVPCLTLNA